MHYPGLNASIPTDNIYEWMHLNQDDMSAYDRYW